jgi:Cdc6-like AAA superfamily ATPase
LDVVDPIKNPYTPGAGTRPSELAGRDEEIENFRVLLARVRAGRSEQSQIITGLRGVGKTVLLNTFENQAEDAGYHTAFRELKATCPSCWPLTSNACCASSS